MKRMWIPATLLLAAGIVMLCLPLHVRMTGVVLLLLGAAAGLYGAAFDRCGQKGKTGLRVLAMLAAAAVVLLMACMSLITCGGQSDWDSAEQSEYAVVLGSSVRADGSPSRVMRTRLLAALEFMERNENAVVILSGGMGGDEPISEARCMYETLLEMGADPDRLLLEDESSTTRENLINSAAIIEARGGTDWPITVITSEFHQRRAAYIAASLGLETCAVSGQTDQWFLRVNYTLREVFAFVKAAFQSGAD